MVSGPAFNNNKHQSGPAGIRIEKTIPHNGVNVLATSRGTRYEDD